MFAKILGIGWLPAGALTLVCLFCGQRGQSQESPQPGQETVSQAPGATEQLTIGAVLPLTGPYAEYGENAVVALQVAAEELNRAGPLRLRLVAEDDQADPAKAVSALQKLIGVHHVKFVIGGFTSSCSEAMYPIAQWSGVLMFSSSTSTPSLTKDTPLFFRNWPSDCDQARIFASQTINRFKKKSASLLYSNSEYGVDAKEVFHQAYEELGGKVVVEEAYAPKATDFRKQIERLLDNPAECIWLFGYYSEMGHFLRQARELGLRAQFFGQEGIEGAELLEIAGGGAEGLIYFVPAFDPGDESEKVRRFVGAFKAKLNREPDGVAAHAYDALHILARSIQAVGPKPREVARHLITLQDYPGVAGLTTLDENGDAKKPVMIKTIQSGRFVSWQAPEVGSVKTP